MAAMMLMSTMMMMEYIVGAQAISVSFDLVSADPK